MEAMIVGFQAIFGDPFSIALLFFGVFMGIVFGCIPGLTAVLGVTLMIPFTYTMTPVQGLTLLVAIYVGGISGGLITATLINIPGTPSSIFTCYDGYPMAKSGKPGTALSIGVFASLIGGTVSALALFFLAPQLSKVSLIFGNWEYFAVALVGLAVVITMASNDLLKGLVGALIGIVLGSFGIDSISGVQRLTFGNWQLMNGLNSTALMMGLFAISEILHQCRDLSKEKKKIEVGKMSFLPPVKEMEGCMVPIVLGCLIGTGIGILPGIGQNASTLITYNQSKKMSKHPERFGHGSPEGICASESSNNAVNGGALIPPDHPGYSRRPSNGSSDRRPDDPRPAAGPPAVHIRSGRGRRCHGVLFPGQYRDVCDGIGPDEGVCPCGEHSFLLSVPRNPHVLRVGHLCSE